MKTDIAAGVLEESVGLWGLRRSLCRRSSRSADPTALGSPAMSAEQVALIPQCAECEARWLPADQERWRAYHTDDEPPELAFYCPDCTEREFGDKPAF